MKVTARKPAVLFLFVVSQAVCLASVSSYASTWAPAVRVNVDDETDEEGAAIDVDGEGVPWVVWSGRDPIKQNTWGRDREIYFSRCISGVWEEPRRLHADNRVDDTIPRISMGRDGVPWVIWKRGYDWSNGNLMVSRWAGGWWSEPDTVARGIHVFAGYEISAWDSTSAWVAWESMRDESPYDWDVFARQYEGGSWEEAHRFDRVEDDDVGACVTLDSAGMPWVGWGTRLEVGPGSPKIISSRLGPEGWSPVSRVSSPGTEGRYGHLATARDGQVWAAWTGQYLSSRAESEIMCARWVSGAWDTVRTANEPDWGVNEDDTRVEIYGSRRNWPVVVWNSVLHPEGPPYLDVRYAAWDGQGWTPEEVVSVYQSPEYGEDSFPHVSVGPEGRVWAAWLKVDGGPDYDQDVFVTYSDDALPVVVHGCSTGVRREGIELFWEVFGYGDLGAFDIYRIEGCEGDTCRGREIPSGAEKINWEPLAGAEEMSYVDVEVAEGVEYVYWLRHLTAGGDERDFLVGREVGPQVSLGNWIMTIYPNPSVSGMSVEFVMASGGEVSFEIYDVAGRKVKASSLGRRPRGVYEGNRGFTWDGRGESGGRVPSGVYMVRMVVAGRPVASAKAVLLP